MQRTLIVLSLFASLQLAAQNCSTFALEDSTSRANWSDGAVHPSGGIAAVWLLDDGSGDIKVARVDGAGATVWQRRIATTDQNVMLSWNLVRSVCYPNGDILVAGNRDSYLYGNCFAIRLDAQGNILWARIYGVHAANAQEWMSALAVLPNGGALMSIGSTAGSTLTALDANGQLVWTKRYTLGTNALAFKEMRVEADGDIALMGPYGMYNSDHGGVLIHTDASGNIEWSVTDTLHMFDSFIQSADQGYVLHSLQNLLKLDSAGIFLWSKDNTVPNTNLYRTRVAELPSGELLISGKGSLGYLQHCTSDGTPISAWEGMLWEMLGTQNDSVILATTSYVPWTEYSFPTITVTSDPNDLSCAMAVASVNSVAGLAPAPSGLNLVAEVDSIKTWTMSLLDEFPPTLDLQTTLSSSAARPGFNLLYWGDCMNNGYATAGVMTATFTYDPLLSFVSASPAGYAVSGNTITWNGLPGLTMWDDQLFSVTTAVPPNPGLIGTTISASLNVVQNDPEASLLNNTATWDEEVTGSYDPNDKLVQPANVYDVASDSLLYYTIRFQNTGNDTAFTVLVVDTLPATVSVSSFLPGASSHPYTYDLNAQGIVQFTFNDILLPDSNVNEAASHGLVAFSVRPDQGLALGTLISNSADIYFDFNPPVRTPPAVVSYGLITDVPLVLKREQLLVYPVPVRGSLTAVLPADFQGHRLTITALDGRLVATAPVQQVTDKLLIPVDGLTQGAYVLEVQDRTGRSLMARFVKE